MICEFFFAGTRCNIAFAWGGLTILVLHGMFKAWLKWELNGWYESFYNTLQDVDPGSGDATHMHTMRQEVWSELVDFAHIVAPAIVVHPTARWVLSVWRFMWRMALVKSYLAHYDVTCPAVEGTAQRIQEDSQRFEESISSCVTILLDSVLTLLVFVPKLLEAGAKAHPPGWNWSPWLLTVACSAAWGGLLVSMFVSQKLVVLEVQNQKVEAAFRTKLVLLEQNPAEVVGTQTLHEQSEVSVNDVSSDVTRGRSPPRPVSPMRAFLRLIDELWFNYKRLFANFFAFNLWIGVYDQALMVLPYMLVAPLMFAEDAENRITLGTLMVVTNSFKKVFSSLAVVTESWPAINDFRATVRRLKEFETAIYTRKRFDRSRIHVRSQAPPEVAVAELVGMTSSTWGGRE